MPIAMSKGELARIKRWTVANREDPETVQKRELLKYMDETSKEMTKSWPNSLENVNKRNEELRQARIAVAEQANAKFYKRYVKRRKEEQERLMFNARDTIFKNKDAPKLLLSAVIETCVQKERMEQVKFNAELKRAAAERKRIEDDEIIRKAKEWEETMAHKRQLRFETDKKYQQDIVDQANEIAERNRLEYETELNMQKVDNMKANQQIEALKEFEEEFKVGEKARIRSDMELAAREAGARRAEAAARGAVEERLLLVLLRARARVDHKRKQTENQIKEEKRRVLGAISSRLESGDAQRAARDQEILEKANREREAMLEAQNKAKAEKLAQFKADRLEQREQFLRDEATRGHEHNTTLQWECMNRFKNLELYDDYKKKLVEEKANKIKEYREDVLRLWKERSDRDAAERDATRQFYGAAAERQLRAADNKLLAHAAALLHEARACARPTLPLHKALHRYCSMYRLYPMPELPASLQEHFQRYAPWDGSAPDADYEEPPRPPRAPHSPAHAAAEEEEEGGAGRNGLQDPGVPSTSATKSTKNEKEENLSDYKRMGRANGLQRRNAHHDLYLPPITVVPCKTTTCSCPPKK